MRIWISAFILAMGAAGCGSSPPPEDEKAPPQETVFDDMLQTEDRAKEAGAKIEDRVNDLNRHLDAQENGDSSSNAANTDAEK
jgi:hypothetical protein